MIELSEIAYGIAQAFLGSGYAAYMEQPTQIKKDTAVVYITIEPVSDDTRGGGRQAQRELLVDLAFLAGDTLTQAEYYSFISTCNKRLRPALYFCGRSIAPTEIATKKVDEVAHYLFRLDFVDTLDIAPPTQPTMEELVLEK